jgi:hypothetical protein
MSYIECMETLNITHPALCEQWDHEANGDLKSENFTSGSHKKVWWRCNVAPDHKWEATIKNRTKIGSGCPCCCNRKVVHSNCLATTHPQLAYFWHDKNELSPYNYTAGSTHSAWWWCPIAEDHVWKAQINTRVIQGTGCPACAGKKGTSTNSLKVLFPEIAKEWDYEINLKDHGIAGPEDVPYGSSLLACWRCKNSPYHVWKATVNNRTSKNHPCPYCAGKKADSQSSLLALHPYLCEEWDWDQNEISPNELLPNSHQKMWWKCRNDHSHVWKANPNNRVSNCSVCPQCYGSAGVHKTVDALNEIGISFSREVRFADCKSERSLPFDFAIYDLDGKIIALVEFQGPQHYRPFGAGFGGQEGFEELQNRDQIKRDYCKNKGIPLLEIHHNSVGKIPQILNDFLESIIK